MEHKEKIQADFLLNKIQEGNEEAFRILFEQYFETLFIIAKNYVTNDSDAEEIIQDVFLKVWKKRKSINKNIGGYLFKVTKNLCLDHLRSSKYKISKESNIVKLEAVINLIALEDPDSSALLEDELLKKIEHGIDLLPQKCRDVFIKSRFNGLKNREISEELNISVKTVENQMSKAIKHMRFHLKDFLSIL